MHLVKAGLSLTRRDAEFEQQFPPDMLTGVRNMRNAVMQKINRRDVYLNFSSPCEIEGTSPSRCIERYRCL